MSLANLVTAFKATFGLLGKTADEQATNLANDIVNNLEAEDIGSVAVRTIYEGTKSSIQHISSGTTQAVTFYGPNFTSGVFYVPKDGAYELNCSLTFKTTVPIYIYVKKGTTTLKSFFHQSQVSGAQSQTIVLKISGLTSSDTLKIDIRSPASSFNVESESFIQIQKQ